MSDSPAAHAKARRLLAGGIPEHANANANADANADATADGAEYVLAHLFSNLSEWVGVTGCNALFARAIVLSAPQHPVLTGVRYQLLATPHLEHLAENSREYGGNATAEAATALLVSIITMLSGLIGEDLAMSLLADVPRRVLNGEPAPGSDSSLGAPLRAARGDIAQ